MFGDEFLYTKSKSITHERKNWQTGLNLNLKLLLCKRHYQRNKRQATDLKLFAESDKGLIGNLQRIQYSALSKQNKNIEMPSKQIENVQYYLSLLKYKLE